MFLTHALRAIFRAAVVTGDSLWKFVTLLISGTPPAVTFISDASTNGNVLTLNGDTRPSNFNPYTPGYYSNFFDGTGDYVSVPDSTAFTMGAGDFTLEAWVYLTTSGTSRVIIGTCDAAGTQASMSYTLSVNTSNNLLFGVGYNGTMYYSTNTGTVPINQWVHVAGVRNGANVYAYLNGVQSTTNTNMGSLSITDSSQIVGIGRNGAYNGEYLTGYISSARIVKGTAVYTAAFTPPTAPLTAIAGTSLLTCQSNRLIDNSLNNFVVTKGGDTAVSGFIPFVTPTTANVNTLYSTYFDGTGDYLSFTSSSASALATGDFTFEMWLYWNGTSVDVDFYRYNFAGSDWAIGIYNTATNISIANFNGAERIYFGSKTQLTSNQWNHLAITRSGNTFRCFINGALDSAGAQTNTASMFNTLATTVAIGRFLVGSMSNVRLVRGTAVYTANFTPSTTPLTAISGTSLLTCQDATIKDNSTNAFAITSFGQAQPVAQSPFTQTTTAVNTTYLGSGYFDGSGDYLSAPNNAGFQFGTGDFTVEYWVNFTVTPGAVSIIPISCYSTNSGWELYYKGNGTVAWWYNTTFLAGTTVPKPNLWYHLAVTRKSATTRLFVNGVIEATLSSDTTNFTPTSLLYIGNESGSVAPHTGYIADLRIVKGRALYTANFAPPATPLTAVANTSLLTLQTDQPVANKQFVDNSGNNFPITQAGNTTQGAFSPYGANWSNYFSPGQSNYIQTTIQAMTANFTVECWVYVTSLANSGVIIGQTWELWVNTSGTVSYYTPASVRITTSLTVSLNTWTHIALVRSSGIAKIYINGVADASTYTNSATVGALETTYIGRDPGASGGYNGYISNLRIVNGTAVYTSTFTPSTTPLTAITNTSLLTCQSPRFIDTSINAYAVTITGSPTVQRFSPFNPSSVTPTSYSGYFDGNGDYLSVPDNAAWNYGTGDFTIEFWVLFSAFPSSTWMVQLSQFADANNRISVFFGNNASNENGLVFKAVVAGTAYKAVENDSANITMSSLGYSTSTWYHVAISRSGSSFKGFINGVQKCSLTSSVTLPDLSAPLLIGAYDTTPLFVQNGYISNLRIVKGTALYTTTFTPSTTPLTTTSQGATASQVSLLTLQSPTFIDNSTNNFTITAFGNSQPTQQNPFGYTNALTTGYSTAVNGGSCYFPTSASYLTTPVTASNSGFGTGDFTVEAWINPTVAQSITIVSSNYNYSTASGNWAFYTTVGSANTVYFNGAANHASTVTATILLNQWTHVAYSRVSAVGYFFINGVQLGAGVADTTNYPGVTGTLYLGRQSDGTGTLTGYMSDLRIVKGTALYKGSFVPPLAPLTATTGTTLLLNMDKGAAVDSSRNNDLETVGDAKLRDETPYAGSYYSNFFNGTSNYFTLPASANWDFGTGDFTIECWVNQSAITATDQVIAFHGWSGSGGINYGWNLRTIATTGVVGFSVATSGGIDQRQFTDLVIKAGRWHHFAIVCASNVVSAYLDGVKSATTYSGATFVARPTMTLVLGGWNNNTESIAERLWFGGNISSFRIVKGTALYTANFTPSTTPLTAITNTQALLCQTNKFVDNSANSATITNVGAAVKSQNPFQKNTYSSMLFDGTGDYLAVPAGPQFNFGTGDFTIEAWVYPQQLTTDWFIISASGTGGLFFGYAPSTGGYGWGRAAIAWDYQPATSKTLNAWQHVAISRSGTSMRIFVDGVQQGTTQTNSTAYNLSVTSTTIGSQGSSYVMTGYIDDLRITRGYARYTANFTPPTAPLPTS